MWSPILESRLIPLIKDGTLREHNTLCRWIVEAPTLVTIRITKEDALLKVRTKRTAFVVVGKAYRDAEWLVIPEPVLVRCHMRSGTCVCSPECVSSVLRGVEGRVGTKTCFTSEFLHCRSSSSGVLLRSGVGRAFATSGAVFASLLGPVLCVLRCCDFGSAVAMAGGLGVTWERAELASDSSGSAGS